MHSRAAELAEACRRGLLACEAILHPGAPSLAPTPILQQAVGVKLPAGGGPRLWSALHPGVLPAAAPSDSGDVPGETAAEPRHSAGLAGIAVNVTTQPAPSGREGEKHDGGHANGTVGHSAMVLEASPQPSAELGSEDGVIQTAGKSVDPDELADSNMASQKAVAPAAQCEGLSADRPIPNLQPTEPLLGSKPRDVVLADAYPMSDSEGSLPEIDSGPSSDDDDENA